MKIWEWHDGVGVQKDDPPVVSIYDAAMMYGCSAFEMLRTFDLKVFQWAAHYERLKDSCRTLGIPFVVEQDELLAAYDALTEANVSNEPFFETRGEEVRTVITVFPGPLPMYRHLQPGAWVQIAQYPLSWLLRGQAWVYRTGVPVRVSSIPALSPACIPAHVKHHNRIHFWLAEREVCQEHDAWAVVRDEQGCFAEGTGSNIFAVLRDTLYVSPPTWSLPGISRAYVLGLARMMGVPVVIEPLHDRHIALANEAFLTCTPYCIVPVCRWDGAQVGTGLPGMLTKRLTERWIESVQCDFVGRVEQWG